MTAPVSGSMVLEGTEASSAILRATRRTKARTNRSPAWAPSLVTCQQLLEGNSTSWQHGHAAAICARAVLALDKSLIVYA